MFVVIVIKMAPQPDESQALLPLSLVLGFIKENRLILQSNLFILRFIH